MKTGDIFLGGGDIGQEQYISQLGEPSDEYESVTAKSHLMGVLPSVLKQHKSTTGDGPQGLILKSSWTGIMCTTMDGVPLVGKLPPSALDRACGDKSGAEWISSGYNGYGMVNAWLCGRATADMILGRDVESWFPEQYLITDQRMADLRALVRSSVHSADKFRALL